MSFGRKIGFLMRLLIYKIILISWVKNKEGDKAARISSKRWIEKYWSSNQGDTRRNTILRRQYVISRPFRRLLCKHQFHHRICLRNTDIVSRSMTLDIGTSNDKDEERKRETEIKRSTRLHSNRERGVINAATIGSASTSRMTLRGGEISNDGSAWNEKIMRIVAAIRSFLRSLGKRKSLLERRPLSGNSILETRKGRIPISKLWKRNRTNRFESPTSFGDNFFELNRVTSDSFREQICTSLVVVWRIKIFHVRDFWNLEIEFDLI